MLIQAYYNCGIILNVASKNFTPPPKVESSVVEFKRIKTKKLNCNEEILIVVKCFNQKEKNKKLVKTIFISKG